MQAVSIDVVTIHVHMAPWIIVPILFDAALGVLSYGIHRGSLTQGNSWGAGHVVSYRTWATNT